MSDEDEVRFVPGKCVHNQRFWLWEKRAQVGCALCDLDRQRDEIDSLRTQLAAAETDNAKLRQQLAVLESRVKSGCPLREE